MTSLAPQYLAGLLPALSRIIGLGVPEGRLVSSLIVSKVVVYLTNVWDQVVPTWWEPRQIHLRPGCSPTICFNMALRTTLTDFSLAWPYIKQVNASRSSITSGFTSQSSPSFLWGKYWNTWSNHASSSIFIQEIIVK